MAADPHDWPYWRGPEYNSVSRETGLVDNFNPEGGEGSNLAWSRADLGGRSTPIVLNGRLYTITRAEPETAREQERVVCVDAASGKDLWENRFNVSLSDVPDTRVGWSSVVGDPETGNVYALGVNGFFQCLDGAQGRRIWGLPLHEQFGLLSTYGGRTNFPVVCEELVIISGVTTGWGDMARPAHRFIGFDKRTGEVRWVSSTRPMPEDTTYSSPAMALLGGQSALVVGAGDGQVWAFQPRTGVPIWNFGFSRRGLNASPVVVGDTVYMGHSEENLVGTTMGSVAAIDGSGRGDITPQGAKWRVDELMVGKSSPLVVDGRVYCVTDGAGLMVLDAENGEAVTRRPVDLGRFMEATPLYADGKIYAINKTGGWYILQPDERRGAKTLNKGQMPGVDVECLASPICAHGRLYLQTTKALYCLVDPAKQPGLQLTPAAITAADSPRDTQPAHVQVVPAESLVKPGDEVRFRVRLFNGQGEFLRESDATFTLEGPGRIAASGLFQAPTGTSHAGTVVSAQVGALKGTARVRIIPELPWSFDFTGSSEPPVTWIGARYRHVVRKVDGNDVMVKVTTIPKGTRSRCWFGSSDLHDYTIQADVWAGSQGQKTPDIGLIAQGYTLDLKGEHQKLEIRLWDSQPLRMGRSADFPWTAQRWYVMKFQVIDDGSKVLTRGKVWPKDAPEPDTWTIEASDEAPNKAGSPGLYGDATNAEIFLDNIQVTPH
jgi:outer membrane protein assembly factor BamB